MYNGSCLCKTVQFEILGPIHNIIYCHCSECRKAQGTAFATNGFVATAAFKIVTGEKQLTAYKNSATQTKYFCRQCGSPIMSKNTKTPDHIRIRLGTIDSDITERPGAHIFVHSKANWDSICDDLPQFEEFEPDRN